MAKRQRSHSAKNRSGSRSGSTLAPLAYETAANNVIHQREMEYRRRVKRESPARDASQVAGDLVRLFQVVARTAPSRRAQNYVAGIEQVMRAQHDHEVSFNIKLYLALRSFLEARGLAMRCDGDETKRSSEPIVLKFTAPGKEEYALGIAREVNWDQKRDRSACSTRSEITVSGGKAHTKLDHCCCLLKKDSAGEYEVAECLAAVELNLSSTRECNAFTNFATICNTINLQKGHGTLAQVMSYTMRWVLPSHAKLHQLGDDIPWAVFVGRKAKVDEEAEPETKRQKSEGPKVNRWVSGKIYIPENCGDAFEFAVTGYGTLEEDERDDDIRDAVSVYLDTILAGLTVGKRWMDSPEPVVPSATSGKKVCIGQNELDCRLRGSATIANFPYSSRKERNRWDVAQGEIFTGKLNMGAIYRQLSMADKQYVLAFNKNNEEVRAVVKVSSMAVHHYLNHPEKAWSALSALYRNRQMRSDLSNVLFAVYATSKGLITIMANLSPTYKALRPIRDQAPLTVLWNAFRHLVTKILFPMAKLGFIHPDIRPGYNITSNILCEVQDGGRRRRARMQLIDYESIVRHQAWVPPMADHRYMKKKANAKMFLWWQCLSIFFAWKEGKSQKQMRGICLDHTLRCDETESHESSSDDKSDPGGGEVGDDDSDESSSDDDSDEESDYGNNAETGSGGNLQGDEDNVESEEENDDESDDEGDDESDDTDDGEEESDEGDGETIERPDWFDKKLQKVSNLSDMSEREFKRALRKLGALLADDVED